MWTQWFAFRSYLEFFVGSLHYEMELYVQANIK